MAEETKTYTLVSNDQKKFTISEKAAFLCNVVQDMVKNLEQCSGEVPLDNVNGETLEKIVEWLKHHENDAAVNNVDQEDKDPHNIPEWDRAFLDAANYLDIKGLLDFCCKAVAASMKGKSSEQIRAIFGIKNDFTPAEEEQIRRENAWCED